MMASLFPPLPDAAALQQRGAVQQLELSAQQDCQSAFDAVRRFEASHNLALHNMGVSFLQQRGALVGSILQKGGELRLPDEVVHDAVLLLHRAGSTGVQVGACLSVMGTHVHNRDSKIRGRCRCLGVCATAHICMFSTVST
jgi:hypothetical protein